MLTIYRRRRSCRQRMKGPSTGIASALFGLMASLAAKSYASLSSYATGSERKKWSVNGKRRTAGHVRRSSK